MFSGFLYRNIVKEVLFLFPADSVHEAFLKFGKKLGNLGFFKTLIAKLWRYDNFILEQNLVGLTFKNPIGLSAGFDYDADLVEILPSIGFGFNTAGTLTHEAYEGNSPPMLGRLPKSKSLLVNKGFKNKGVTKVLSTIRSNTNLLGISIGATNKPYSSFEDMVENLVSGFRDAENFNNFNYYELNISCPNLLNIQNLNNKLDSHSGLKQVLTSLEKLNIKRPVFIKMPLEKSETETKELIETASPFSFIKGLIFANLAKDRKNPTFNTEEIKKAGKGGFSGKPTEEKSNQLLRFAYKLCHDRFLLIGVGGIFTAEDAYRKILSGASVVQLITGMIFMGPQQVGVINKDLVTLLKRDGYNSIKEAVGAKA
ncbi:MAG: dihydroorotate dehydrogenase (quinone) [bacterium]|nr:dihydroorotate dehydrogenase (quinone) [bacterium]